MKPYFHVTVAVFVGLVVATLPATPSHALTCKKKRVIPRDTLKMPTTLTPRGVVYVAVIDWKKVRDVAALVEVGKPDGTRWALEPVPSWPSQRGGMLLRPATPLPVGKRVMFAPSFDAQRVKRPRAPVRRDAPRVKAGWLVVAGAAKTPPSKPKRLKAVTPPPSGKPRSLINKGDPGALRYGRQFSFEPAPPPEAVLVRVTATPASGAVKGSKPIARGLFAAGPKLRLYNSHCDGNFRLTQRRTKLEFAFLDGEGKVIAIAQSPLTL